MQILRRWQKLKIKRVYHHFSVMEEYKTNMWKQIPVEQRESKVIQSRDLMLDFELFKASMIKAVDEWPYSCEANLSASVINHQAWLGHAGCAINHDAPEDLTRQAWSMLTKEQQDLANKAADEAKEYWVSKYAKN
jgi:hypothetical protein